jgi:hypothetical protein
LWEFHEAFSYFEVVVAVGLELPKADRAIVRGETKEQPWSFHLVLCFNEDSPG